MPHDLSFKITNRVYDLLRKFAKQNKKNNDLLSWHKEKKLNKRVIAIITFLLISVCIWGQKADLFSIVPQGMLIDEKNPVRYSYLNLIDSNPETVYAIENSKINLNKPFLVFYFSTPVQITGFKIKHGYFDERYFKQNNRLAKIKVTKKYQGKQVGEAQIFSLADVMEEQNIVFSNKEVCREIIIELVELYKGSTWDDTVVSDIQFLNNSIAMTSEIVSSGEGIFKEYHHSLDYDIKGNLIKEFFQFGKAASYTIEYVMDSNMNRPALAIDRDMDEDFYINFFYTDYFTKNPKQKIKYNTFGETISKTDFAYNGEQLITEVETLQNGELITTSYIYENNTIKQKKVSYKNKKTNDFLQIFFYSGNKIIAERYISGIEDRIMQYIYKNNLLEKKVCVFTKKTGINYEGFDTYPDSYFYTYSNNKLIEESTVAYWGQF